MKARLVIIAALGIASSAAAQTPESAAPVASTDQVARCTQGLDFATKGDLPRAYLYLEKCDPDALDAELAPKVARTKADVAHKLDGSKLSALAIVTTPEGLIAESDAIPGERFTTPATIWTKAGDFKVNVAADAASLDAGKGMTTLATLAPFSRRTVIINVPQKKGAPKDGKVDFNDEEPEAAHVGPPPAVKHGTLLPKKYIHPDAPSGPQLDDPFALREDGSLAWRFGARIAGGVYTHDAASNGAALGVAALATRSLGGPIALATRVDWAHRDVDSIGLDAGVAFRLAGTQAMVLSLGTALHGEVRVQNELAMQPVSRVGVGAAASLDLSLLSVPLAIGLRVEPSFTELVPGSRTHAALLEVGYDWR